MSSEIKTWQIIDGKLLLVNSSLPDEGRKEREDLENWIKSSPAIIGNDIAIIGEQVQTASGPLDFLGIDNSGNAVIIELKRDRLPREALAQAIDYASDISNWGISKFEEVCQSYTNQKFEDFLIQEFEEIELDDLTINQAQRILLVGFSIEESLSRMIEWLSDNYGVAINAILLNYVKTQKGDEILSRTVIIPEEIERQIANKKKFTIPKSDEPGSYEDDVLEEKLKMYLSKKLYSAQRIRDFFLPILIEKGKITRDQLRKEFVRLEAADDKSQAGYFLALISNQLGHKWKDYLRQIIYYEYPNHPWEKDNFRIREGYTNLVKKVLSELNGIDYK